MFNRISLFSHIFICRRERRAEKTVLLSFGFDLVFHQATLGLVFIRRNGNVLTFRIWRSLVRDTIKKVSNYSLFLLKIGQFVITINMSD